MIKKCIYSRDDLFLELKSIVESNFYLYDKSKLMDITFSMLIFIGDVDAKFRDEYIYTIFSKWITEYEYYKNDELLEILDIVLDDNHLFYNLGNNMDDSVFTRSFSVLIIPLILEVDEKYKFITDEVFENLKERFFNYLPFEKDFRGYVANKGWAHAVAHIADAMCSLLKSMYFDKKDVHKVLDSLEKFILNDSYIFKDEEDERLTLVISVILSRDFLNSFSIIKFIKNMISKLSAYEGLKTYVKRVNLKNFVRSLIFSFINFDSYKTFVINLYDLECKLNEYREINRGIIKNNG